MGSGVAVGIAFALGTICLWWWYEAGRATLMSRVSAYLSPSKKNASFLTQLLYAAGEWAKSLLNSAGSTNQSVTRRLRQLGGRQTLHLFDAAKAFGQGAGQRWVWVSRSRRSPFAGFPFRFQYCL